MSRYPGVCLCFIPCISLHLFPFYRQTRPSMGTTTTNTCPIQRRNHTSSRTTSKILSHTAEITNHLLFQLDPHPSHGQEYPIELFIRGPRSSRSVIRTMSITKLLRNTHRDLLSSSPFSHAVFIIPATNFLSAAAARCFAPVPSYSTSALKVPPSTSAQSTSTTAFRP